MQLPVETTVKQVQLNVANLDNMIDFYTKIIGLKLVERLGNQAMLSTQGSMEPLLLLEEHPEQLANSHTTGLYHTAFLLPSRKDLGNTLIWLLQNQQELGAADHGYSEALYLTDPEGNGIEIYHDKPMDDWDIRANGEIVGVTEELDGAAVAEAADGQWLGLAPGSRLGHIHLQVADLEETQRFYEQLGFSLTSNFGRQAKFFAAGNYHHHIGTNTWAGRQLPLRSKDQLGLTTYTFQLPSKERVEELKVHLKEQQLLFEEQTNGVILADPNGMFIAFQY